MAAIPTAGRLSVAGREVPERGCAEGVDRLGEDRAGARSAAAGAGGGPGRPARRAASSVTSAASAAGMPRPARPRRVGRRSTPDREVTGHLVARGELAHLGDLFGAPGLGPRAAGAETAARRRVDRAGGLADQGHRVRRGLGVGLDRGGEERRRVVVGRRLVEQVGGGDLAEAAQVHDGHPVAHVLDHRQVVGDEEDGQVVLLLQVLEQVEDLGLHGHVERRDDLVAHQELGLEHQRTGDADALALASGELAGPAAPVE